MEEEVKVKAKVEEEGEEEGEEERRRRFRIGGRVWNVKNKALNISPLIFGYFM
jgi:hypothetical protein